MQDFDAIIKPLLEKKIRIKNINRFAPKVSRSNSGGYFRPVITPLGKFPSITKAAEAHGMSKAVMFNRLKNKVEGFEYDVELS